MNPILFFTSMSLYFTGGILYLLQIIFIRSQLSKYAFRVTAIAWLLSTVMLGVFFFNQGYPFLVNESSSYLFSTWVITLLFLILNYKPQLQLIGVFVLPLVCIFHLLAFFSEESYQVSLALSASPWASIHFTFSFLTLAILSLSFALAIMFIIEEFQLKYKVLPKIFLKLPNLEFLEKIHARALSTGFILLSGVIITGAAWAKSVRGLYFFDDARQLWAVCAWLVYALFLHGRFAAGWRGRRGVFLSMIGFIIILFTFLGVRHNT